MMSNNILHLVLFLLPVGNKTHLPIYFVTSKKDKYILIITGIQKRILFHHTC